MPWRPADAKRHTKKATSAVAQRRWAHVANSELSLHGDEARAIRAANSVIAKRARGGMKPKKR